MMNLLLAGFVYWAIPNPTWAMIAALAMFSALRIAALVDARHEALISAIEDTADDDAWLTLSKDEQEKWMDWESSWR